MNEKHTLRKSILKKEPLKYASTRLISEAKRHPRVSYFLKAECKRIDHQQMLVISIYAREKLVTGDKKPDCRIFMTKYNYITQVFREEKMKWQTGRLVYILDLFWSPIKTICCVDASTTRVLQRFFAYLNAPFTDPIELLKEGQSRIREQRLEKKHKVIEQRIDEKMREIRPLPKDFGDWVDRTAMAHSRYIYYQYSRRKYMDGYCTCCRSDVKVTDAKHRKVGFCPNCGKQVIFLAEGKARYIFDRGQAAYFQKTKHGFVVRYFSIYKDYRGNYREPRLEYYEWERHFYEDKISFYEWRRFLMTDKVRWCEGVREVTYEYPVVYTKNLNQVLKGTKYQYCALKNFALRWDGAPVHVMNYLWRHTQNPFLEYLVKMKLYRMAEDVVSPYFSNYRYNLYMDKRSLHDILGVQKKDIPYLQETNMSLYQLGVFQKLKARNEYLSPKAFLEFCADYHSCMDDMMAILKYTTFEKADRYICGFWSDIENPKAAVHIWLDYLRFSEELGRRMKDKSVLFPRNLVEAHDEASADVQRLHDEQEKRKLAAQNRIARKLFKQYQAKYFWTDGTYSVIAPKELFDIKEEGYTLHHCVGTYIPRVMNGSSIILFVRKNDALDKPFYTMELVKGEVRQCRGYSNRGLTEELQAFVERYEKEILNGRMKKKVA